MPPLSFLLYGIVLHPSPSPPSPPPLRGSPSVLRSPWHRLPSLPSGSRLLSFFFPRSPLHFPALAPETEGKEMGAREGMGGGAREEGEEGGCWWAAGARKEREGRKKEMGGAKDSLEFFFKKKNLKGVLNNPHDVNKNSLKIALLLAQSYGHSLALLGGVSATLVSTHPKTHIQIQETLPPLPIIPSPKHHLPTSKCISSATTLPVVSASRSTSEKSPSLPLPLFLETQLPTPPQHLRPPRPRLALRSNPPSRQLRPPPPFCDSDPHP